MPPKKKQKDTVKKPNGPPVSFRERKSKPMNYALFQKLLREKKEQQRNNPDIVCPPLLLPSS